MRNLQSRLSRLEARAGIGKPVIHGVWFVTDPEQAHKAVPERHKGPLWGSGPDTWRVYVAPGQTEDDALKAAGIDTDKDKVLVWGHA